MASVLKLGLYLPSNELGPDGPRALPFERLAELVLEAERNGFHSVWFPDHYFIEAAPGQRRGGFECWTLLSALAAHTSQIRLGSLVLCNSFRHPAILAKQAATLQEISGGRVILGLGAGWHEPEYRALGLPFDHRVSRLEESAAAIRELFDTGTSSFQGRWLHLENADLSPRPEPAPPLWIAATGPKMLDLTARYADGWNLAWFGGNPAPFIKKTGQLRDAAKAAGREDGDLTISVGLQALITADGGEDAGVETVKKMAPAMRSLEPEQVKQRTLVAGVRAAATTLRAYAEGGAELAIIGFPGLGSLPADGGAVERLLRDLPKAVAAG